MLFERYTQEVPLGDIKKIFSINLVKDNLHDKERHLAEYYEELLELCRNEFERDGLEIGYHNFPWHAATKHST